MGAGWPGAGKQGINRDSGAGERSPRNEETEDRVPRVERAWHRLWKMEAKRNVTAGWTGWDHHTGVFKPSSLPLFSPNYSHSLSITPHNSGKLSNGRNNSNFNLSVPVVSTKKMLSRALRLKLPQFGGQRRGGRARPPAHGCLAKTRAGTFLQAMGEKQEEHASARSIPARSIPARYRVSPTAAAELALG